ncbi:hypothetical protein [Paenibacillus sp. NPDC093718]|uniref:hypothetical protein n=1 Tax=Paenibacillus sp. NPDC093718 TaxID=3390601 RepID=UPI003CFC193C
MKRKVKDFLNNSKTLRIFMIFSIISLFAATPIFASQPKIVSGGIELVKAATGWLMLLIPVTAVCMFVWHAWMKSLADGEGGQVAERNKKMKNVIIYSAIALGGTGLVNLLLGYLK